MKKKKITFIKVLRRLIQLAAFILIPGLFITAFGALGDVYQALIQGSFSVTALSFQLLILLAVIPVTMLLGRFFCGYLCAFGSMGDLLWFIAGKIHRKRIRIGEKTDKILKSFKYILLIFIVVFVWTLGVVSFDPTANPWTIFGMYASISGWPAASYLISVGGALLLLIIVGSLFVERFFCRYACPLGAVFSVVSLIRPFKIKKPRTECGACKLCTSSCPMGIELYKTDVIRSGECINCFNCIESCRRKNVSARLAPPVAAACAAASIAGLYYAGNLIPTQLTASAAETETAKTAETAAVSTYTAEAGPYIDGTYEGSARGFRGTTDVAVTIENGYIEDITVISTDDDLQYFNRAENSIVTAILLTQSPDVDAVSGATFSSNAITDAVADALEGCISNNADSECSVSDSELPKTSEEASPSASEATADTVTDASGQAAASVLSGVYEDGTYTGTGTGFRGSISVTVTVSGGQITDITVVSYDDDYPYMVKAESVIDSILSSQELDVDAVSGATFSSNGIIEAVADALGVSYASSVDTSEIESHSGGQHGGGHNK